MTDQEFIKQFFSKMREPFPKNAIQWLNVGKNKQGTGANFAPYLSKYSFFDRLIEASPFGYSYEERDGEGGAQIGGIVGRLTIYLPSGGTRIFEGRGFFKARSSGQSVEDIVKGSASQAPARLLAVLGNDQFRGGQIFVSGQAFAFCEANKYKPQAINDFLNNIDKRATTLNEIIESISLDAGVKKGIIEALKPVMQALASNPEIYETQKYQKASQPSNQKASTTSNQQAQAVLSGATEKQKGFFKMLLSNSVFTDEERAKHLSMFDSQTNKTKVKQYIDWAKEEVEKRSSPNDKVEAFEAEKVNDLDILDI